MINEQLKIYEENERYLCYKLFQHIPTIRDYYFTNGKIAFDTIITLENETKILGEVKVRQFEANKYPDYILEVSKLISLIKRHKEKGTDLIYYFNFFDGKKPEIKEWIIFNLTPRIMNWKVNKPKIEKRWMNEATFVSNHKIQKEVIMLQFNPETDMRGFLALN